MKILSLTLLFLIAFKINAQQIDFQQVYTDYPNLPSGLLEAVSFSNTHMVNLDGEQESCIGIPQAFGVMGLYDHGHNYFLENGEYVAKLSGISVENQKGNIQLQVRAYGKAFSVLLGQESGQGSLASKLKTVLEKLSQIPELSAMNLLARDLQTSEYLNFMNSPNKAQEFNFSVYQFDLEALYGANNLSVLLGQKISFSKQGAINEHGISYSPINTKSTDYGPAIWDPAPACNFSSRNGVAVSAITIHTVQGTYAGAISWAQNCSSSVSYHYVIRSSDGQITQLVFEADKGWHVGSENPYTIGYEHEGYVNDPSWYTEAMYNASADLSKDIVASGYGINPLRTYFGPSSATTDLLGGCTKIKGHQHYPNQTHTDPGINWDWEKYYRLINDSPTITTITSASGSFFDTGGSLGDYGDDERELWLFEPVGATSVTLDFTMFSIELDWDFLYIYDGNSIDAPLIGVYTGTTSPGSITSSTGSILVEFRSDCATVNQGWEVNYSSAIGDNSPPTTSILNSSTWQTNDFNVEFVDSDSESGVMDRFYLVTSKEVTDNDWSTIPNANFAYESFEDGDDNWFQVSGTYSVNSGSYSFDDISNQNSNTYMALDQPGSQKYLYAWDMTFTSAEVSQRAGIHFFCDDPNLSNRGNSYFVYLRQNDGKVQIYSVDNDVFNLEVEADYIINSAQEYACKASFDPMTGMMKAYIDDSLICQWQDLTPLTEGAFISLRTGGCSADFDNIRVFTNRGTNESISANGASDWLNVESLGASPTGAVFSIVSDSANNWSAASQEPILLDFSTPEITFLNDGVSNDIDTLSTNSIDGNWLITDPHSDIADFQYAVGTLPNLDDVISWTSTGITTSFSDIIANPIYEQVYHISVSAANNAGLIGTFVSDGQIYLDNLSEIELDLEKIVLYPNPASHMLSIEGVENMSVQIYDNVGRAVTVQLEQSNGLIQLDISQLAVGNYKLVIGNENSFIIRKVQVTR